MARYIPKPKVLASTVSLESFPVTNLDFAVVSTESFEGFKNWIKELIRKIREFFKGGRKIKDLRAKTAASKADSPTDKASDVTGQTEVIYVLDTVIANISGKTSIETYVEKQKKTMLEIEAAFTKIAAASEKIYNDFKSNPQLKIEKMGYSFKGLYDYLNLDPNGHRPMRSKKTIINITDVSIGKLQEIYTNTHISESSGAKLLKMTQQLDELTPKLDTADASVKQALNALLKLANAVLIRTLDMLSAEALELLGAATNKKTK